MQNKTNGLMAFTVTVEHSKLGDFGYHGSVKGIVDLGKHYFIPLTVSHMVNNIT